jgi:hypothetical protein
MATRRVCRICAVLVEALQQKGRLMASDNITSMPAASSIRDGAGRVPRGYAEITALQRGSIGAVLASSQAAMCGVQEMTSSLLAFVQSRAKDGLAAGQQFAACRSPEAVLEVQLDCAKAMLQAYTDEFGRLHALTGKILADILVPVRRRAVAMPESGADSRAGPLAA